MRVCHRVCATCCAAGSDIVGENRRECALLLLCHVHVDTGHVGGLAGLADGDGAADRETGRIAVAHRVGPRDVAAIAGGSASGRRWYRDHVRIAGGQVDQVSAELVLHEAGDDPMRARNHRCCDRHRIRPNGLHGVRVDGARHADAPQRDLDHRALPGTESGREREHHDDGKEQADRRPGTGGVAEHPPCLRRTVDLDDGGVRDPGGSERHDKAGELSEDLTDDRVLGLNGVRAIAGRCRKDVPDDGRRPIIAGIERGPHGRETVGWSLRVGWDGHQEEQ